MTFARSLLKEVIPNENLPIYNNDFGLMRKNEGELTFVWSAPDGLTPLPKDSLLFTLVFESKRAKIHAIKNPPCWTSSARVESIGYSEEGEDVSIRIQWEEARNTLNFVVNPNPFQENLTGFIYSEGLGAGKLLLSDIRGKVYMEQTIDLIIGENYFDIPVSKAVQPGIYFCSFQFEGYQYKTRIVKMSK